VSRFQRSFLSTTGRFLTAKAECDTSKGLEENFAMECVHGLGLVSIKHKIGGGELLVSYLTLFRVTDVRSFASRLTTRLLRKWLNFDSIYSSLTEELKFASLAKVNVLVLKCKLLGGTDNITLPCAYYNCSRSSNI
jgi:hypothetical protein